MDLRIWPLENYSKAAYDVCKSSRKNKIPPLFYLLSEIDLCIVANIQAAAKTFYGRIAADQ